MHWFLIITTFYTPNVPVKVVEMEMPSQQACEDAIEIFDSRFKDVDESFGYILRCEQR